MWWLDFQCYWNWLIKNENKWTNKCVCAFTRKKERVMNLSFLVICCSRSHTRELACNIGNSNANVRVVVVGFVWKKTCRHGVFIMYSYNKTYYHTQTYTGLDFQSYNMKQQQSDTWKWTEREREREGGRERKRYKALWVFEWGEDVVNKCIIQYCCCNQLHYRTATTNSL